MQYSEYDFKSRPEYKKGTMQFEKGYIYHIYNQGNNKQKIFFNKENYLFFLQKINTHILPYADVMAWCLMPNHFHLMVYVREVELIDTGSATQSRAPSKTQSRAPSINNINKSIGILLASYTRAINKQQQTSGTLFRQKTKAECVNCPKGITPSFIKRNGVTEINIQHPEKQYTQVCFNYIHQNPVKAKLALQTTDWEFSSAIDYANLRDGKLINKKIAAEYVDIK